jgi:DNA modification methylase
VGNRRGSIPIDPTTIAGLTPDPHNRRTHNARNVAMIAASLTDVGAARSIVIDEHNEILAGNGVVQGATAAGLSKLQIVDADGDTIIAVRRRGLTAAQKRSLAIFDNRAAELAAWNVEQLTADLTNGEDLTAFFLPDELQALLSDGTAKAGLTDPDTVPDERRTGIVAGDLFELGAHRLLCGDSTTSADVARLCGNQRAGLMNTDPPYGIAFDNAALGPTRKKYADIANDKLHDGQLQAFLESAFRAATGAALTANAAWYLWHAHLTQGFFAAAAAANVVLHRQIIWVKPRLILGRGHYHWKHEPCFMGWVDGHQPPDYGLGKGERTQTTVWELDGVSQADRETFTHATPKPVALFLIPIVKHLKSDELAYEPFAGSGPQFIAAQQTQRRCFGIEIAPSYCQVIIDRWEAFTGLKAIKVGEPVRVRAKAKRAR